MMQINWFAYIAHIAELVGQQGINWRTYSTEQALMKRNSAIKLLAKEMVMVIGALLEIKAKWDEMNNSQDLHTVSYIPDSLVKLNQLKKKKNTKLLKEKVC